MAKLGIKDDEDLCICPYDPLHCVQWKKFSTHLQKCSKEYKNIEIEFCPFNSGHAFRKGGNRLTDHLKVCKDKDKAIPLLQSHKPQLSGKLELPKEEDYYHEPSENWDDEVSSKPIIGVPAKVLDKKYKDTAGMKRLEKKKYRERLMAKLTKKEAGIDEDDDDDDDVDGVEDDSDELQPLPKPKRTDAMSHLARVVENNTSNQGAGSAGVGAGARGGAGIGRGRSILLPPTTMTTASRPVGGLQQQQQVNGHGASPSPGLLSIAVGVNNSNKPKAPGIGRGINRSVMQTK